MFTPDLTRLVMIQRLLSLPANFAYRVLFLERRLEDVQESQTKMMEGWGHAAATYRLPRWCARGRCIVTRYTRGWKCARACG
jgi:hypothetical protein